MSSRPRAAVRFPACLLALAALLAMVLHPGAAQGWGLAAHAMITRQAIEACPAPLREDLREQREALIDKTLEPDTRLRPRHGKREAVRHYLNLELLSSPPFEDIPSDPRAAKSKYGERRLRKAGRLPWHAGRVYAAIVSAMKKNDRERMIRQMGYLAHYVSDAYSPLHATTNYDGQLTGNKGIHRRYETALIKHRAKFFRDPGRAGAVPEAKITDVAARMLGVLRTGHALVPSLLAADRKARRAGRAGSAAYLDALFREVGKSARERMRGAVREIAALWTSAWIEAGRPRLTHVKTGGRERR